MGDAEFKYEESIEYRNSWNCKIPDFFNPCIKRTVINSMLMESRRVSAVLLCTLSPEDSDYITEYIYLCNGPCTDGCWQHLQDFMGTLMCCVHLRDYFG